MTVHERRRWDACIHIARTISEVCEQTGADERVVWFTSRWLFNPPLPLDEAERDAHLSAELPPPSTALADSD
ncbi:MAG: hypothetical protein ACXVHL_24320 [Solirubrobacteraceae bacterium]